MEFRLQFSKEKPPSGNLRQLTVAILSETKVASGTKKNKNQLLLFAQQAPHKALLFKFFSDNFKNKAEADLRINCDTTKLSANVASKLGKSGKTDKYALKVHLTKPNEKSLSKKNRN